MHRYIAAVNGSLHVLSVRSLHVNGSLHVVLWNVVVMRVVLYVCDSVTAC